MRRRNAIVWKDFYKQNQFCEHITLENGEGMLRFIEPCQINDKTSFRWICEICQDKSIVTLENDDKGNDVDNVDV